MVSQTSRSEARKSAKRKAECVDQQGGKEERGKKRHYRVIRTEKNGRANF